MKRTFILLLALISTTVIFGQGSHKIPPKAKSTVQTPLKDVNTAADTVAHYSAAAYKVRIFIFSDDGTVDKPITWMNGYVITPQVIGPPATKGGKNVIYSAEQGEVVDAAYKPVADSVIWQVIRFNWK